MQLSCRAQYLGYNPTLVGDVTIRFNGLKLYDCLFADEDNGIAVVMRMDLFEIGMVEIPLETLRGDVWILLGDRK
jgi:hypothetical protein